MKKIVFIAPARLPIPAIKSGGIEQLIQNIIDENEKSPRIHIILISAFDPDSKPLEKNYKNTKFINVKYSYHRRIFNYLNRKIFSRLFGNDYFHFFILQIMAILSKIMFDKVVIFGNDTHILPVSKVVDKSKIIYYDASILLQRINDFSLASKILVGSNYVKTTFLNHSDILKKENIKVIQAGIDIEYFKVKDKEFFKRKINERHLIDSNIPIICYVGRLSEDKGILPLLQAVKKIENSVHFKLIVIGSFGLAFGSKSNQKLNKYEQEVDAILKELGERCLYLGFIPGHELIGYLAAVDIGIVPSIAEDPSPLAYFQYQAMGIPTIVSDSGGIPEFYSSDYSIMVKRGPNFIVDLKDAMKELISDSQHRSKMAIASLKNREHLGSKRFFNDFIKAIND